MIATVAAIISPSLPEYRALHSIFTCNKKSKPSDSCLQHQRKFLLLGLLELSHLCTARDLKFIIYGSRI
jgi:hypothetical protein